MTPHRPMAAVGSLRIARPAVAPSQVDDEAQNGTAGSKGTG